jgi:methionyl-tRNA formyltransferase
MDAGLDTGDILLQRSTFIGENETAPELMERLSLLGAELLSETLANLSDIEPRPQEHEKATLAPIMKREDGLIDWSMSAVDIANRVRGFQPFPTAFTYFRSVKLTIWSAASVSSDADSISPGEIIEVGKNDLQIGCGGSTMLTVKELQIEGKRRTEVRDFVNGFKPLAGERFGDK